MYGAVREKSIDFLEILYRLFSDRIGRALRSLPSSAPIPRKRSSVTSRYNSDIIRSSVRFIVFFLSISGQFWIELILS